MGEAIVELVQVLNSKEPRITKEEADIFLDCKNQGIKGFAVGGTIASGLVWVGTRKLNNFLRINLALGGGFIAGMWVLKKSIDSSVNDMLVMEGSRVQQELRNIVLEKYGNNPQRMKPFAKHFYIEEVLNDSDPGNPKTVYRHRNSYGEDQLIANRNTYGVPEANKSDMYRQQGNENPDSPKLSTPSIDSRTVRKNPTINVMGYGDPMDVLFGYSPANDESPQLDDSATLPKSQTRSQRRAHRKHKTRHRHRDSLSLEEA